MNQVIEGGFTGDPLENAPEGIPLIFESIYVTHHLDLGAFWVSEWGTFKGILLSLHFGNADSHHVDGSAVMVAPGVAICARHVLDHHAEALEQRREGLFAAGFVEEGIQIWRVTHTAITDESDLAILGMTLNSPLPAENRFRKAAISTRLPRVGERLMVTGFRASEPARIDDDGSPAVAGNFIACVGEVTQAYPQRRDSVFMPWPALEVNCPAWGGMSGGPVFDTHGKLIGIVASSFETEDNAGPTYVSLLWPILGVQFEGGWPRGLMAGRRSLLELDPRLCEIDRRQAIRFLRHDAQRSDFFYDPWQ